MQVSINYQSKKYQIDIKHPISIAIDLNFNGTQPNTYGVDRASCKAFQQGEFIGDVNQGGSCNFEQYTLVPHCNGTHTECVGHISQAKISIHNILKDAFLAAGLISVPITNPALTEDSYIPAKNPGDEMITIDSIKSAIEASNIIFFDALIIRTLPNDDDKKGRDYTQITAPYFSKEAMEYIRDLGVQHLLVDFPSVDRTLDEGKLNNHRIYWEIPIGDSDINPLICSTKTITEMIFVPSEVKDNNFFLNIQIPAFVADAAPSRPILFPIQEQ